MNDKTRLDNLNILRGFSAFIIVLYHIKNNVGCNFGAFNWLFGHAAIWMTVFFVLSGFTLYYNYCDYSFDDFKSVKSFMRKRLASIYPTYALIWIVYFIALFKDTAVRDDIITFPMQFSLLFSVNYYNYLINTGLWFFSCIFVCYLIFPYLCSLVKTMTNRDVAVLFLFAYVLNSFLPFKVVGSYYSAFCRVLEFTAGICTAKIFEERKIRISGIAALLICVVALAGNFILEKINFISLAYNQERINFFSLPMSCVCIYALSCCRAKSVKIAAKNFITTFFSEHSLGCYVGALPAQLIFTSLFENRVQNNVCIFLIVFVLNIIFAVLIDKYSSFSKKIIAKIGLKKIMACYAAVLLISIAAKILL